MIYVSKTFSESFCLLCIIFLCSFLVIQTIADHKEDYKMDRWRARLCLCVSLRNIADTPTTLFFCIEFVKFEASKY